MNYKFIIIKKFARYFAQFVVRDVDYTLHSNEL